MPTSRQSPNGPLLQFDMMSGRAIGPCALKYPASGANGNFTVACQPMQ
ncbi:MAG TPA: hypothetical protein VGJ75_24845 [Dongiaceae bacterium]